MTWENPAPTWQNRARCPLHAIQAATENLLSRTAVFAVSFTTMLRVLLCLFLSLLSLRAAEPDAFRVMTYNIHHGEGIDKRLDLERIAKLITDAKADVVALQEVDRGVARTAKRDLPAELAKLTGMTAYFENNFHYQGGEYGNAVLTRFPIKRAKNTHYKMLRTGEQRGVLQLVLDVHGHEVLFMNTHIDYRPDDAERLMNVDELKQIVADADAMPVILCGDFNATPESRTIAKVKAFLADTWELIGKGDGFSIPTEKPRKRIDYIWISKATIEPLQIEVLKSDASDHLPVMAQLRLK
jgi:endonuclease/exonuclease/phosphatase family metal-dependent hydrolase